MASQVGVENVVGSAVAKTVRMAQEQLIRSVVMELCSEDAWAGLTISAAGMAAAVAAVMEPLSLVRDIMSPACTTPCTASARLKEEIVIGTSGRLGLALSSLTAAT